MLSQYAYLNAVFVVLSLLGPQSQASGYPHAHGSVEVELVLESNGLMTGRLFGAIDGFLPFEHAPKTEAQRRQLLELQQHLTRLDWLLTVNPEGQCLSKTMRADSSLFRARVKSGHADLEVQFSLQCASPSLVRIISFPVFVNAKRLKKIELEYVGPQGQSKAVLSPRKPQFVLP
ncbi:MAG: hypothetical protein RLZZ290_1808 [Pseudomonadota bacterium]|jgi:hypothetical protein